MPLFEIRNLSLEINGKKILDGLSFSVENGAVSCIIGPNGAGKSSLLSCLGRLNGNFSGEILLDGKDICLMREREIARRIAWLHQTGTDMLAFSVREFAKLSRYPWHKTFSGETEEDKTAVEQALALAGVESFADRKLNTLSGGERQRALLAAAIAQGTDILFLDEPTSFLDYKYQEEMLALIEKINRERNMTVLMVTHDVNIAVRLADRIFAVKQGKLAWNGITEELLGKDILTEIFGTEFVSVKAEKETAGCIVPKGLLR